VRGNDIGKHRGLLTILGIPQVLVLLFALVLPMGAAARVDDAGAGRAAATEAGASAGPEAEASAEASAGAGARSDGRDGAPGAGPSAGRQGGTGHPRGGDKGATTNGRDSKEKPGRGAGGQSTLEDPNGRGHAQAGGTRDAGQGVGRGGVGPAAEARIDLLQLKDGPIGPDDYAGFDKEEVCRGEDLAPGEVLWHVVLNQYVSGEKRLYVTFQTAGSTSYSPPDTDNGSNLQWFIITPTFDTLTEAYVIADAGNLVLSHVCTGEEQQPETRLRLVKVVINDDGGTAVPDDWQLSATAGPPDDGLDFANPGGQGVFQDVYPGVGYDLEELGLTPGTGGYIAGVWECDGGELVGSTVTLAEGDHVTCTITNDDGEGGGGRGGGGGGGGDDFGGGGGGGAPSTDTLESGLGEAPIGWLILSLAAMSLILVGRWDYRRERALDRRSTR
jgi:hypothetical protein